MKPRIRVTHCQDLPALVGCVWWSCADPRAEAIGLSPADAYSAWVRERAIVNRMIKGQRVTSTRLDWGDK